MIYLQNMTLEQLKAEQDAQRLRIADLEFQNIVTAQPNIVRRRKATIRGQKKRLKRIEGLIKNAAQK